MTLDLATLSAITTDLGRAPVTAICELTGGSSATYRLDLEDGTSLVFKAIGDHLAAPRREAHVAGLLANFDIPVTRHLLTDESRSRLPMRFTLTNYLDGAPATTFAAHPGYLDIHRQIGTLARKLHAIELGSFGHFPESGGASPFDTEAAFVRQLADNAFNRFVHYGGGAALAQRLRRVFDEEFENVVGSGGGPVFAHDDLHPGNILVVETEGRLSISGLIDFGNALASTALMDLAKTIFICEHSLPGSRDAILAGYGPIDHPEPERALAFHTLLHRIIMWWWLRHIGALATPDAPSDIIDALKASVGSADGK